MTSQNQFNNTFQDRIALSELSAKIGADPLLIQAAGGNTSVKSGNVMWIKASGTLLSDAIVKDIFVPVNLEKMRVSLQDDPKKADHPVNFLIDPKYTLHPSIETSLHAVFPQKVVLHAHCIHTLGFAICNQREVELNKLMKGLNWGIVPYVKPGANLANTVKKLLTNDQINIVILKNHGLIVAADSLNQAENLLYNVHNRLKMDPTKTVIPNINALKKYTENSEYYVPKDVFLHQVGLSKNKTFQAISGSLYPDHVIFCGIGAVKLPSNKSPNQFAQEHIERGEKPPIFIIIANQGILIHRDASSGARALIRCLSDVLMRLPKDAKLNYLTLKQNHELLDWDAEKYRQSLNAT